MLLMSSPCHDILFSSSLSSIEFILCWHILFFFYLLHICALVMVSCFPYGLQMDVRVLLLQYKRTKHASGQELTGTSPGPQPHNGPLQPACEYPTLQPRPSQDLKAAFTTHSRGEIALDLAAVYRAVHRCVLLEARSFMRAGACG